MTDPKDKEPSAPMLAANWSRERCITRDGDRTQIGYEGYIEGYQAAESRYKAEVEAITEARLKDAAMATQYYNKNKELDARIKQLEEERAR